MKAKLIKEVYNFTRGQSSKEAIGVGLAYDIVDQLYSLYNLKFPNWTGKIVPIINTIFLISAPDSESIPRTSVWITMQPSSAKILYDELEETGLDEYFLEPKEWEGNGLLKIQLWPKPEYRELFRQVEKIWKEKYPIHTST